MTSHSELLEQYNKLKNQALNNINVPSSGNGATLAILALSTAVMLVVDKLVDIENNLDDLDLSLTDIARGFESK